jgi:N-acetylmuramoyl-L-alanine amidase
MEHISCPGVLIECGFLSNYEEEAKLRNPEYQKQLACIIAAAAAEFVSSPPDT